VSTVRIAVIGFGTVGRGFAEILARYGEGLRQRYGIEPVITAVSDLRLGGVRRSEGWPADTLLRAAEAGGFDGLEADARGLDALTTIREADADAVAELSFTDLRTGQPALDHMRAALERGLDVITTNKGPVALHFAELTSLAASHGAALGIEGTVMSGTPVLSLGGDKLAGAVVHRIQGILNGTTNYMLTRMEGGLGFDEALAEAQREGYAEADPSGDVDGVDAAGKAVILANVVMGAPLTMADVPRRGIRELDVAAVRAALDAGERWRLLATIERGADGVTARVAPERLPGSHPLAQVRGATNAATFATELLGDVTLIGPGAGRLATGYALVEDLLALRRGRG
jgi:homoserine dehydrogenase